MKSLTNRRSVKLLALVAAGALALGACGGDDDDDTAGASEASTVTTEPAGDTTTDETEAPDTTEAPAGETIVDIAAANPDFSTLVAAVQAAGLAETLSGDGPFTVFAPTNEAFAKLPAGTVDSLLLPENKDQLAAVLTYHVVAAEVMAADVTPGPVTTVNGATFDVAVESGGVVLTDGQGNPSNVVTTDIVGSNGVIHVIDTVLLPPA
jgi:uncharacterized surface protein with fasciclin (FAS1) repeats